MQGRGSGSGDTKLGRLSLVAAATPPDVSSSSSDELSESANSANSDLSGLDRVAVAGLFAGRPAAVGLAGRGKATEW